MSGWFRTQPCSLRHHLRHICSTRGGKQCNVICVGRSVGCGQKNEGEKMKRNIWVLIICSNTVDTAETRIHFTWRLTLHRYVQALFLAVESWFSPETPGGASSPDHAVSAAGGRSAASQNFCWPGGWLVNKWPYRLIYTKTMFLQAERMILMTTLTEY